MAHSLKRLMASTRSWVIPKPASTVPSKIVGQEIHKRRQAPASKAARPKFRVLRKPNLVISFAATTEKLKNMTNGIVVNIPKLLTEACKPGQLVNNQGDDGDWRPHGKAKGNHDYQN